MSGAGHRETKTSPRSAPAARGGPAPLTARRSGEHRRRRAHGPTGSPPARRGRCGPGPPAGRFPPNLGTARLGTMGEVAPWAAGLRRPSGLGGNPRQVPLPSAGAWPHSSPGSRAPLGPPHKFSRCPSAPPLARFSPASPAPPLTRRRVAPEPPPPPGLSPSRRPPPHVPRVAIAFALAAPFSPPQPSLQSPAQAEAAPAAAARRSRRPDPRGGACALRAAVGAGGPAAAWEQRARGTWRCVGRGRLGARERPTFRGRDRARCREVLDAAEG